MSDQPYVQLGCVSNLFSRMMHFKKTGDKELGHAHAFDHLTLLAAGSLQVTVEGNTTVFHAPHMIFIKAEKVHELVSLKDDTVAFCIHALRDGDRVEDIIDPNSVPNGVKLVELTSKLCV